MGFILISFKLFYIIFLCMVTAQDSWDVMFWNWVDAIRGEDMQSRHSGDFGDGSDVDFIFTYRPGEGELVVSLSVRDGGESARESLCGARDRVVSEISGEWEWDGFADLSWGTGLSGSVSKEW